MAAAILAGARLPALDREAPRFGVALCLLLIERLGRYEWGKRFKELRDPFLHCIPEDIASNRPVIVDEPMTHPNDPVPRDLGMRIPKGR